MFRANSVFRASASCSKFLNDRKISIQWKIPGQLWFSGQAQVAQKSWMIKNTYSIQWKIWGQLCFQDSASCSKILNDKKYIFNRFNSGHTLFFRASASSSKILNDKNYIFNTVNSGHTLCFRASASCSKIRNVKKHLIQWKFSGETLFSVQAQVFKNPECKKIFNTVKISGQLPFFRASASCSKIRNVKKNKFNTVKNFRTTLFSGQAQVAQKSWTAKKFSIFNTVYIHLGVICVIRATVVCNMEQSRD